MRERLSRQQIAANTLISFNAWIEERKAAHDWQGYIRQDKPRSPESAPSPCRWAVRIRLSSPSDYAYDREQIGPYAGCEKVFNGQLDPSIRGGETRINGVDQSNPAYIDRLMAGMTCFLPGQQQVIVRFARNAAIDNGCTRSETALRYQIAF